MSKKVDLFNYQVGQKIKTSRKNKKLKQSELGEIVGLDATQISTIETGKTAGSVAALRRIATALGTTLSELFAVEYDSPSSLNK